MKRYLTIAFLLFINPAFSQDLSFARKMLDTLTSPSFWGRGYTRNGMQNAANFIATQFKQYGLSPLGDSSFKQSFSLSVNTFPGKMDVVLNSRKLIPGVDFVVNPESMGQNKKGLLEKKDSTVFIDNADRIIVELKDKLTWSVSQKAEDYTGIQIDKKIVEGTPQTIEIDIENKFITHFNTYNVCGMVKGTDKPDSILVITAHYDHLGGMGGETYFPGANDNASGVSLLLSLARYYAAHPQSYSIAFLCFGAEEAGIVGSQYFTEHPLINLNKIRFLINVDLVGTGETGITVVNATLYPKEFAILNEINNKHKYLVKINPRGKAANSDHYFFTEKGVPAFFIYTQGGIAAYHDVNDKASTLPLTEYDDLFKLFIDFNKRMMK